ncbi:MAG: hypothetical protein COW01_08720 [Bdellovibrionales bacterium CG12_big_fil_rev_8_21_14_0_65_38_15]|nr:MAG: hypothetical protein COW79_01705 [Bdellovibrionales bacterium CG22_combo_CG10-13_8_21_14_all_38_13]PIQ55085.1 MAG: hypothetical protein COW01_08720 [Bdellovibrionales bacterium CG12_big_fil_rev_8_21_14_0_65_38_15]PIR30566.1 MAG: hypothetical protein COV38_05295 [Bdellovibrionales bacterium CG11_big_fil_rev_8_21_14_0_20_38_13]
MTDVTYNRLKDQNSLYLKQHKDNPVHWWPYGPEALLAAKEQNKPIFLSIGYSSCHWCHVMAEESFQDQNIADLLNKEFVCIKVDREEHPDLDSYYQQACQLFTKSGGWPLSAFLLPDMRPYFVGTYFPPTAQQEGQATFGDVLLELSRVYKDEKEQVLKNAEQVSEAIVKGVKPEQVEFEGHFPPPGAVMNVLAQFQDAQNGGFGAPPKFPLFSFYEWALEQMLEGMIQKDQGEHIIKSIERMMMGGIYDHARGGFHRYSTDNNWLVPHFEKMLYDQAGLLRMLSKASMLYPSPLVYDGLMQTLEFLEAEMLSDEGYAFAAQDADCEGVEGLYQTFSLAEFEDAVNNASLEGDFDERHAEFKEWFSITEKGNFDQGLNVISLNYDKRQEFLTQENWPVIRRLRKQFLRERSLRIPPATDNKGIASWNFQLISAMVDVMQYCQVSAIKNKASHLFNKLVEGAYKTFLVAKEGEAFEIRHTTTKEKSLPYLEDFVFFAEAQIRMYEITGNPVFKDNFRDTMSFISKSFIKDNKVYTRPVALNDAELYPNLSISMYDQSYRSCLATLFGLARRGKMLLLDKEFDSFLDGLKEDATHETLRNPLSGGEGLRALTYPDQAYRTVKLPLAWLKDEKFIGFMSYFLPRFVLTYHEDKGDEWQICSLEVCELQGHGLDQFIETLRPSKKNQES